MELITYQQVGSTQDVARQVTAAGHPLPFAIAAATQSAGRGRDGKSWNSPPGGLWLTTAFDVPSAAAVQQAAMAAAQGVAAVLTTQTGLQAVVKWPNDLLLHRRKVCGILAETLVAPERTTLLLGIGLNVNNAVSQQQLPRATSVSWELGHTLELEPITRAIVDILDLNIDILVQHGFHAFSAWMNDNLALRGELVTIEFNNQHDVGRVTGVSETGGLLLQQQDGSLSEISAGSIYLW
ncbi:MAG: biotin--[acetyl-CoA-carboxylase] ligase [Candidatus Cryosericum sp.]|nr:biotin--[acetyl-CoA-carboxylase] ligase [bacterium]